MSLYSDYLAPDKYRDGHKPPLSDRAVIALTLAGVALFVTVLIGGSQLLMKLL